MLGPMPYESIAVSIQQKMFGITSHLRLEFSANLQPEYNLRGKSVTSNAYKAQHDLPELNGQ